MMLKDDYIQFSMTLTGPTVIDITGSNKGNFDCSMITVKCVGSSDEQSHHIAYQGLKQLTKMRIP